MITRIVDVSIVILFAVAIQILKNKYKVKSRYISILYMLMTIFVVMRILGVISYSNGV
jgi:hypothetical protein